MQNATNTLGARIFILALLATTACSASGSDAWQKTVSTPVPPTGVFPNPSFSHTAVWTGSEMIVWGGLNDTVTLNSGGRYSPSADQWTTLPTAEAPSARSGHSAVWTGAEMIIWGGTNAAGSHLATGGRYNAATNIWTEIATAGAPSARSLHTAVWTGAEMIVWGGSDVGDGFFNTGARYNPTTNTGARYNPATGTWTDMTNASAPSERVEHTAVWTGSDMIVWGGGGAIPYSGADDFPNGLASGGRYTPATDTWTAVTPAGAPGARRAHTAVWTGSEMIVGGGWNSWRFLRPALGDCGHYYPSTNSWGGAPGAPGDLLGHTALWTGGEVLVFGGGANYSLSLNDAWRYPPASHRWTAASTVGAPGGRKGHTAVWTGTEMIVWGGFKFFVLRGHWYWEMLNDGGLYTPLSNSWSALPSTGSPSARSGHSAIWTGTEMIVWGGHVPWVAGGGEWFLDGARYTPATGTWKAVTTVGAPSPRYGHTAVWTGSEMIVWGAGADGSRYNPTTDTWTAVNPAGAPAARWGHTAIWTGREMIVWGGVFDDNGIPRDWNSGARYSPATDTWTPMNSSTAPAARNSHTAVWSGSEMIIWGGSSHNSEGVASATNSGGRYSPETDTWTAMTTAGAPSSSDTAVWTGYEMIVLGASGAVGTYSYIPDIDAASFPITSAVHDGGNLILSFPSVTGRTYTLWSCDTFANGTWTDTGLAALAGTGATLTLTVPTTTPPTRFFRIQASP